ncbi:MAG: porin family protein [Bacteroidota bacterium]
MTAKLFACLCFLFLAVPVLAQDTIPTANLDDKYREDQFYVGVTYNLLASVPSNINLRGLSGGVQFGFMRDMPVNERRNVAIALGAGLAFDQYGSNLFIGENPDESTIFSALDSSIDFDTNRFSAVTVEAPLEFRWRTSTAAPEKFWRIYGGVRVGYTYYYRALFTQPNNKVSQTDIPEFQNLRLGATLSFGYGSFNFHAHYSITPFFENAVIEETGETFDFRTLKVGVMFYIL